MAIAANDWTQLARRARRRRVLGQSVLVTFLIVVSLPILLPYFWMLTISVSAKTGGVESVVLWRACAVLAPALFALGVLGMITEHQRRRYVGQFVIIVIAIVVLIVLIGKDLHVQNYRFLWNPNIVDEIMAHASAAISQFPWVWTAFGNSLLLAGTQTALVVIVSTLAGYYLSRFSFTGRASFLQTLLILHAFPAMTLVIPIFFTDVLERVVGQHDRGLSSSS